MADPAPQLQPQSPDVPPAAPKSLPHITAFYTPTPPPLPPAFSALLTTYAKVPAENQAAHVLALRDDAYKVHPYPCLGLFMFTRLALLSHPLYKAYVLPTLLKDAEADGTEGEGEGEIFLDLGTCLGQDLRQLRHAGVPSQRLYGADLEPTFIDLGYRMFCDGDTWPRSQMLAPADVFDVNEPNVLSVLDGRCTIVQTNAVFHLFDYEDQLRLARRVVRMLRPGGKRLILGAQNGNVVAGEFARKRPGGRSGKMYRHDEASWGQFWQKIAAEQEGKVTCEVTVHRSVEPDLGLRDGVKVKVEDTWRGEGYRWMIWSVWVEGL